MLVLCSTLIFSPGFSQVPSYVPSNGLAAWWPLDNSGNDVSGNGNHFVNYGLGFSTDRFNQPNAAVSADGTTNYMLCNSPSFSLGANSSFSVSVWIQKPTASYGVCLMHGTTAAGNFIWNIQTGSSGVIQFGANKQQSAWIWTQTIYSLNAWEHYVGVFDNGAMSLYKNGILESSNLFTHTSVFQAILPLYLGRGVSGAYFTGKIDDVGIWTRALSTQEIIDLYTSCSPTYDTLFMSACDHYTWPLNSQTYTQSGIYNDTIVNSQGCDSVVSLNLSILPNSYDTVFASACDSFLWMDGIIYTSSTDSATFVIPNATGCDSIITLNLTIVDLKVIQQPADNNVSTGDNAVFVISSSPMATAYQWQTNSGGSFQNVQDTGQYSGAQSATLTVSNIVNANHNQAFRCVIYYDSCVDTSELAIINVLDVGLWEGEGRALILAYPNPASQALSLQVDVSLVGSSYAILDCTGKRVYDGVLDAPQSMLYVEKLPAGLYLLRVNSPVSRTLRLVVH